MDSFIRAYTNVIEKEHTEKIIKRFDEIADKSYIAGDAQFKSKARRHDDSIMLEDHSGQLVGVINKAIEGYLKAYLDEFPGGNEIDAIGFNVKLQRTYPGVGIMYGTPNKGIVLKVSLGCWYGCFILTISLKEGRQNF